MGSALRSPPDPASWQRGLQPPPRRDSELPRRCWGPARSQPAGPCALVAARDLCASRQCPRAVGRCPSGPQHAAPGTSPGPGPQRSAPTEPRGEAVVPRAPRLLDNTGWKGEKAAGRRAPGGSCHWESHAGRLSARLRGARAAPAREAAPRAAEAPEVAAAPGCSRPPLKPVWAQSRDRFHAFWL